MSALDALIGGKGTKPANQTAIDNAMSRLKANGTGMSDLAASYGDTGHQSLKDQALTHLSPLMNLAGAGLNVLERPGQAILHGLNAFSGTHGINPEVLNNARKQFWAGLIDVGGKDNFNLRRTINMDPNAGGRPAGLFDTIGTAALDPVSYLSLGTGAVAKTGLKVIGTELGDDMAKAVAKKGIKSLAEADQVAVKKALLESEQAAATKGGAEKFANTAARQLEGGAGIKFAGKTVLKYDTLAPAANAAKLPEIGNAIKTSAIGDTARKAVVPFAEMTDAIGPKASKAAQDLLRKGRAVGNNGALDAVTQTRAAVKGSGLSMDEIKAGVTSALDTPVSNSLAARMAPVNAAKAAFTEQGKDEGAKLIDTLMGVRNQGTEALRTAGADQGVAGQLEATLTKEMVKAIHKSPTAIAKRLGLDASATPANIAREIQRTLPHEGLQARNARLSELLGVKNAIETNPLKVLVDQTVKAHQDAATADTLKGLMEIMDKDGKPLISTVARPGDVTRETILGTVHGPKEVLDELDHAAHTLQDDHALKQLGTVLDKWGKIWRGYATVPVLFGLGFHERNLVGNVFNMWLLGFHDPRKFHTADKILRAIESGTNGGLTADAAIDGSVKLSQQERQYIRLARQEGVIGDSFFRTDQATAPKIGKSLKRKVVDAANPASSENAVIKSGAYIGRRIEDNSRLAMFIDQMEKHGDPQIAADNVKKALFDYSELTESEKALKKVIPFYTYMRKNTPLQIQSMLQNPGKFSAMGHAKDNAEAAAVDTDGNPLPQYALANGSIPLFGAQGGPIMAALSTPYDAAAQQIQPIASLLSQLPGVPKNLKTEGGTGEGLRQILGNFGGGPTELAKLATEQATGRSLFTGQDLKPGTGVSRTVKALVPLAGKGESTISDIASGDESRRNARLIAALTGLSTTAVTDNRVEGEKARRAKVLQELAKGSPTLADLRKQGKVAKAKKSSTKITKSKGLPKAKKAGSSLPKPKKPKA